MKALAAVDPGIAAATRAGILRRGVAVTLSRTLNSGKIVTTVSADLTAAIYNIGADFREVSRTGYAAAEPGSITQDERRAVIMADDLSSKHFPLPVAKGDQLTVKPTGERFRVTLADAYTRALAGAIDLTITGVG